MFSQTPHLIGPAAAVMAAARAIAARRNPLTLLLDGDPGIGKTTIADALALELTGTVHAIETVNGQSLSPDLVREWRFGSALGNLFSDRTVKRIEELDQIGHAGGCELLSYLDTLPRGHAVIATTNDFARLRSAWKGRLETRFARLPVEAPPAQLVAEHLQARFRLTKKQAIAIARGAVPNGQLDGANVRAAILDADALTAITAARKERP